MLTGKQLSGPGGVDPRLGHHVLVVTGIGEVGLLFSQTSAGTGDRKIRGRFPTFNLVRICPVGTESKLWGEIIMMSLTTQAQGAGPEF